MDVSRSDFEHAVPRGSRSTPKRQVKVVRFESPDSQVDREDDARLIADGADATATSALIRPSLPVPCVARQRP